MLPMRRREVIEVFMVGSPVIVGQDITATVIGVEIREKNIRYECAWWSGRERKTDWLESIEVRRADKSAETKIGFST